MLNGIFVRLLLFILIALVVGARPSGAAALTEATVVSKERMTIETMSEDGVCGRSLKDPSRRICVGRTEGLVSANDTVSKVEHFVLGQGNKCAIDERGVRCWETESGFARPLQEILSAGDARRAQFWNGAVCVPHADETIHCYSSYGAGDKVFGPIKDLREFALSDAGLCALSGDALQCMPTPYMNNMGQDYPTYPTGKFPGARTIAMTWDSVCILAANGLNCIRGFTPETPTRYQVGLAWTKATGLSFGGANIVCSKDEKSQPLCVRLSYDSPDILEQNFPELQAPGVEVLDFKAKGDLRCARVRTPSARSALFCGAFQTLTKVEAAGDDVRDFALAIAAACSVDSTGIVDCFYDSTRVASPLPEDGSAVFASGGCRWNNSRFHCGRVHFGVDFSDIAKVIHASTDALDIVGRPCMLVEDRAGIRKIKCFGSVDLASDAPPVDAKATSIVVHGRFACTYGGADTTCWGEAPNEAAMPELRYVRNIAIGSNLGCAIDKYGFACWGPDLESRHLQVPPELSNRGVVTDFSIGGAHVCAITHDGKIQCWGDPAEAIDAPVLTAPTSIKSAFGATCASSDEGVTCWGERGQNLMKHLGIRK